MSSCSQTFIVSKSLPCLSDSVQTTWHAGSRKDVKWYAGRQNEGCRSRNGFPTHLETVFRIVNEESRRTVENLATRALREGVIVGLANHTLLIARDGTERSIDDSAAPIRDDQGNVAGVVIHSGGPP